jgi:hypothetical protein
MDDMNQQVQEASFTVLDALKRDVAISAAHLRVLKEKCSRVFINRLF